MSSCLLVVPINSFLIIRYESLYGTLSRVNQLSTQVNAVITPQCFQWYPKSHEISTSTALRTVMIFIDTERDPIYRLPRDQYDLEEVLPYLVWTSMNNDCCLSANNDGSFRKLVVRLTSELFSLLNLCTILTSSCFVKFLLSIVYLNQLDIHKARSHNLISIKNSLYDQPLENEPILSR